MMEVLAIALGAAIGAPSRFILDRWVAGHAPTKRFPWSLLVVNVLGSAIAGAAFALSTGSLRVFLLVGVCGALTTFTLALLIIIQKIAAEFKLTERRRFHIFYEKTWCRVAAWEWIAARMFVACDCTDKAMQLTRSLFGISNDNGFA